LKWVQAENGRVLLSKIDTGSRSVFFGSGAIRRVKKFYAGIRIQNAGKSMGMAPTEIFAGPCQEW
jgi:hypothetical protein